MADGPGRRLRRLMLDFLAGKAPTAPAAWYVALAVSNCGDDGQTNTEPTIGTGSYARKQMTGGASDWTAATVPSNDAPSVLANAVAVAFATSSAAWSTGVTPLTCFEVWDHATSRTEANFIGRGPLTASQIVNATGITINFAIGQLSFNGDSL